jgi:hypothetical protein
MGFLTTHAMTPDGSFAYLEASIGRAKLNERVPEALRRSFDRARELHLYGLFRYGFFTIANQIAWSMPEAALGLRFVAHYAGTVPFNKGDERRVVQADSFRTVVSAVGWKGDVPWRDGWRLEGHERMGEGRIFDATYRALIEWGRREGLLAPWLRDRWDKNADRVVYAVLTRSRPPNYAAPDDWGDRTDEQRSSWWAKWRESTWERDEIETFVQLRNLTTHSSPGDTVMPVDSARALEASAAFINFLWRDIDADEQASA